VFSAIGIIVDVNTQFHPLILIGPSGVGKSHTVSQLVKRSAYIRVIPTWTDRPKRPDENELEHRFVTKERFDALHASDAFLEVVTMFSLPFRYGFKRDQYVSDPHSVHLVILRATHIPLAKKHFKQLTVYQIEAPTEQAHYAIRGRKGHAHGTRMAQFKKEIAAGRTVADRIYNNVHNDSDGAKLINTILKDISMDFSVTL
jgi:guanylate kinase